ncbi:MAG: ABC transporter ATP-binding protein [Bryobacteraceae bacterium]|jgi:ABC-type Fe3+/spermidine/putrescine transport system ATPase subunit
MESILELRDLVKLFPNQRAVDGISLKIPRAGFYSLLGPSGCGKTTTLRLIAGFEQPTSGEVLLNGVVVNEQRPYQRNVSTVFQNYALFPHLTAAENIAFGLKRKNQSGIEKRVREALELVRLAGKESRYPAQLSGGERQRVALARSLVLQPEVLLLDEPLAALDPKLRKQMRLELKEMQRRVGITFLLVTHDQEEALSMSDQLAVMNAGAIEQVGTPQDVYLRPSTRFVAGFLGAVNWIDGIGLRPEVTRISRTLPSNGGRFRPATVTGSVFLGNCVHVLTRLESGEDAVAEIPRSNGSYQTGEAIHICWNPSDEMIFQ